MHGFTFSWKRFLGITQVKQQIAHETGIPTTQNGLEREIGGAIIKMIFGKRLNFEIIGYRPNGMFGFDIKYNTILD